MANAYDLQILNDGYRNAIVRVSGILDSGDADLTVTLDTFTNNDVAANVFRGLRLDSIDNQIGDGLQIQLFWTAAVEQLIFTAQGRHETSFKKYGGLEPVMTALNYTGNIHIKSIGYNLYQVPPQTFSLTLHFVKLYI